MTFVWICPRIQPLVSCVPLAHNCLSHRLLNRKADLRIPSVHRRNSWKTLIYPSTIHIGSKRSQPPVYEQLRDLLGLYVAADWRARPLWTPSRPRISHRYIWTRDTLRKETLKNPIFSFSFKWWSIASRQSAKRFLQSSAFGTPLTPHPQANVAREGLGESQFRRGDIHCGTLYKYVLCGPSPYL